MQCPACGAENTDEGTTCAACGQKLPRRRRGRKQAAEVASLTPGAGGRVPLEIIAYRCAVIGLIPFAGLLMGPAAVVLALLASRRRNANPAASPPVHIRAALRLGCLVLLTNWIGFVLMLIGLTSASP